MTSRTIASAMLALLITATPAAAAFEDDMASIDAISDVGQTVGMHMSTLVGPELYTALERDLVELGRIDTTACTQPYADYVAALVYVARSSSRLNDLGQLALAVELITTGIELTEVDYMGFVEACS